MSIIKPDIYSFKSPQPIQVYGEALVTSGLFVRDGVNGFGLVTRGLTWEMQAVWLDIQAAAPITTTWSAAAGASITTTWTPCLGGIFGDYQT